MQKKSGLIYFLLLPLGVFLGLVTFYLSRLMKKVSSNTCEKKDATLDATIELFNGVMVKCEPLNIADVSGIYSSLAAWITILFLALTLLWQSRQMNQSLSIFSTQLDWEKSKLANQELVALKNIIMKYQEQPPYKLIQKSNFDIHNIASLAEFTGLVSELKPGDFDEMQENKDRFESDIKDMKKSLALINDLLDSDRVLKHSRLDSVDRSNLKNAYEKLQS